MVITKKKLYINPLQCFTKSAYARHINKSPTWVDELIKQKKLTEVKIKGGSFVLAPFENSL